MIVASRTELRRLAHCYSHQAPSASSRQHPQIQKSSLNLRRTTLTKQHLNMKNLVQTEFRQAEINCRTV